MNGSLNGLFRLRKFHQDDAHIFVRSGQIKSEIKNCLEFLKEIYDKFDFKYSFEISLRPKESLGDDDKIWNEASNILKNVLNEFVKENYDDNKDNKMIIDDNIGGGAFYGPKIDIHIKDSLNRSHQCASIQLDFMDPLILIYGIMIKKSN